MGIYVKGLNMPSSCLNCKFTDKKFTSLGVFINCNFGLGGVVGYNTGHHVGDRHPNCPLVELPEKHGRLIDADELTTDNIVGKIMIFGGQVCYSQSDIDNAPTVIEAEGE